MECPTQFGDTIELEAGLHQIHLEANATDTQSNLAYNIDCIVDSSPTCYIQSHAVTATQQED